MTDDTDKLIGNRVDCRCQRLSGLGAALARRFAQGAAAGGQADVVVGDISVVDDAAHIAARVREAG